MRIVALEGFYAPCIGVPRIWDLSKAWIVSSRCWRNPLSATFGCPGGTSDGWGKALPGSAPSEQPSEEQEAGLEKLTYTQYWIILLALLLACESYKLTKSPYQVYLIMNEKQKSKSVPRRGRQMARTDKGMDSNGSDDHMARIRKLRKDSVDQTLHHTNKKVREPDGLRPLDPADLGAVEQNAVENEGPRILDPEDDLELARGDNLILALRVYDSDPDSEGNLQGRIVNEDEFCKVHRSVRSERAHYRDLNGQMVKVGQEIKRYNKSETRTVNTRRATGVLKSIMARLMPHEGLAIEVAKMTESQLAVAIDATVTEFESATGCEVMTAAVHRMSRTDCHIHIQYTMVQAVEESSHMLGRRLRPWKKLAVTQARESLAAEEIRDPKPATIGKRKRELIECGKIPPPPGAKIEFRKFAGIRDLGDGAILGPSFRQKLNIVRAAEVGGETELAKVVTSKKDEKFGRFTPIARRTDAELDEKYLDLWLERLWRRNVTSKLPKEIQEKLISDGVRAAQDYAAFGTTAVEEEHIRRRTKELKEKEEDLLTKTRALKEDAIKARVREEQNQSEIAKAQKSAKEANAEAESLGAEMKVLRGKADLCDQVVSLLSQLLDLPGVGLIARKMSKLWQSLKDIGPQIGLSNKLEAIENVRKTKPNKSITELENPRGRE